VSEAAAAIENALANLERRAENFTAARAHSEAQIRIEKSLGRSQQQLVSAYALLGQILERLDEYEESEAALREAVRLSEAGEGGLQRHTLPALMSLAALLNERGKPEEAAAFGQKALETGEKNLGPDAPNLVRVLVNLAQSQRAMGDLPAALRLYERAQGIVDRHRDDVEKQNLVAFYRGFGSLELELGETERAKELLAAGLAAAGDDPTLATARADVLVALAAASHGTDDDESAARLREALALLRSKLPDAHPSILRVINQLCGVEAAAGAASAPDCEDAATRLERGGEIEPYLRAAIHSNQSLLSERRGDGAAAEAHAVRSLAAATSIGTPDPLFRSYHDLAKLLHSRGEDSLAIFFGKQAISEIERMRGRFVGEARSLDRRFLEDKVAVYRAVADWLMGAGRIDEGLQVLRLLKNEELNDFAVRDVAKGDQGVDLTDSEKALLDRFTGSMASDRATGEEIDRLTRLRAAGKLSVKEHDRLTELLVGEAPKEAGRAARIQSFVATGTKRPTGEVSTKPVQVASMQEELRRFGPDTVMAYYLLAEDHLRIVIATKSGQSETKIDVDAAALRRDIGRFLEGIARRDDVTAAARSLYDTLAKPVDEAARKAGATRLVLWLDGALRYVPFGALQDGKRYLVDRYAVEAYATSAGTKRAAGAGAPAVRGLGVTRDVGGYGALPAVAGELCSIVRGPIEGLVCPAAAKGALEGAGFADASFTEERLEGLLSGSKDYSVLHLGTHFHLRPGNSLRSFLVLGDGSKLTLDRIQEMDFSGIALLTLSACQTGLGGATTDDGREVEGLSAVVQRRGAANVVASLWRVEDASTARLMNGMYRDLASGKVDAVRALQRAQQSLRAYGSDGAHPYEHPYYWAGFVLSGSAR
jgi:CHAT domain-containing protein